MPELKRADWKTTVFSLLLLIMLATGQVFAAAPPTGSIAINSGAAFATTSAATLSLTCSGDGSACSQMQLSNDNFTTSTLVPYAPTESWTLSSGDGNKTVSVKFKDEAGNWSSAYSAAITLDTVPPLPPGNYLDSWTWRNPLPTGNCLKSVTYGNSMYVAVGDVGTIITSPDGINWTVRSSGTTCSLTGVTYGNATFVAVGNGAILTSPDGVTWTTRASFGYLTSVAYGNSRFVAVGEYGNIWSSPDGISWSSSGYGYFYDVTYANSTFVAVGWQGSIATSPDGMTWTQSSWATSNNLNGVAYSNSTFVAVGDAGTVLTSPDGLHWTTRTSGLESASASFPYEALRRVSFGGSNFVAFGYSGLITSPDGITWTTRASSSLDYGIVYGNATFVKVGFEGAISTSPDGMNWTSRANGTSAPAVADVTYGNATFVSVGGSGTILTSVDGVTWTARTSGTPNYLSGITYGNSTFVSVGGGGTIVTSTDGVTWTVRASGTVIDLAGVTYGNSNFVAVGAGGEIFSSIDGVSWSRQSSGTTTNLQSITYGNNIFVAVGLDGTIITSPNGFAWTIQVSGTTNILNGVTYSNSTFVSVGQSGTILTSPDGVTWTVQTSGTTNALSGVSHNSSIYIAMGEYGTMLTSPDGITWTVRKIATNNLYRGAYGNSTFVVTGIFGTILQSDPGGIAISINNGAPYTNMSTVTLTLACADSGSSCNLMQISNDNFATTTTIPYVPSQSWELSSGDGIKNVSVRFQDGAGNWSAVYNSAITLYANPPEVISTTPMNGTTGIAIDSAITVGFSNKMNKTTVIPGTFSLNNGVTGSVTYDDITRTATFTPTAPLAHNTLYTVTISSAVTDLAGNMMGGDYTWSFTTSTDISPPAGSITISSGATYATTPTISLALTCLDDITCSRMQFSNDNSTWSTPESFGATKTWQLSSGDGNKTVYARFRDDGGNWSETYSAAIILDTTAPAPPDGYLDTWYRRSPITYWGLAYNGSVFVTVGTTGVIQTSPDGTTWTSRLSGTPSTIRGVTYGNSTFVAVGSSGTILTSPDGVTWSARTSGTTNYLYGITYNNSTFVAVGQSGTILTSPDGVTWSARTSGTPNYLIGITYGSSTFVAVGQSGTILTSPDGVTWSARTSGTSIYLNGITYGNSTFVAVGSSGTILTSPDGVTWTARTSGTTSSFTGVTYGNATFVAVGSSGTILTSPDGVTWSARTSGTTNIIRCIAYGAATFVAAGDTRLTSSNGISWVAHNFGTVASDQFTGVAYGNAIFAAVAASGKTVTSPDGAEWTTRETGGAVHLYGITYGNSKFVSVGYDDAAKGVVKTSIDGSTWNSWIAGTDIYLNSVTYGNSIFVAVGSDGNGFGTITTSPDGETWTTRNSGAPYPLYGVTYGNGVFVAVGDAGTILHSTDGITWATIYTERGAQLTSVTYGTAIFVAVGDQGNIIASSDGINWSERSFGAVNLLTAVAYGNDAFVAMPGSGTTLLTSNNGITWATKNVTVPSVTAVTSGKATFVAVGNGGAIFQSGIGASAITINSGESSSTSTAVTLALSCTDSGSSCVNMQVTNDNFATFTSLPYSASQNWTLTDGDGAKTVSVRFQDGAGNWSSIYSASINLDINSTITPSATTGGSISPNTPQIVANGTTTQFTVTANAGFSASVGGTCGGTLVGTTYTTNTITTDCSVMASFVDITPDTFTFSAQTTAALSTATVSNSITVSGISTPVAISVTNGEYSIDGGAYTSAAGTVTNGQQVTVRTTSAAAYDQTQTATLTISTVSASFAVTTAKMNQTISFTGTAPSLVVGGSGTVAATATSALAVSFSTSTGSVCSVSGTTVTGLTTGTCSIRADQAGSASYNAAPQVTLDIVVGKGTATITLGSLSPTYDGTAKAVTATTNPAGKSVTFTYDGSATAPTNAGSYTVVATINDTNYQGTTGGTLTIGKAGQTITFNQPAAVTYGVSPITLTASGGASGNPVTFSIVSGPGTLSGTNNSILTITGAGTIQIAANQAGNGNYTAATAVNQSLTVNKAQLIVAANPATRSYNSANPTFSTGYSGFVNNQTISTSGITGTPAITTTAVIDSPVGSYPISTTLGTLASNNYSFSFIDSTLTITKAAATVNLSNLSQTYDGTAKTATITTIPAGLNVTLTYNGSAVTPVNVGNYTVVGTINDNNYQGSSSGTLIINPAPHTLTVSVAGSGTGTVTSAPAGISCTTTNCTGSLGGTVTLYATPSILSKFGGWGGGICSGTAATCTVTMDADKTVTASFNLATLLHIGGTEYQSLQDAYDAATDGTVIQLLQSTVTGTLNANKAITIKLNGGYDSGYSSTPGTTAVTAPFTITQGTVVVDRIVIQ